MVLNCKKKISLCLLKCNFEELMVKIVCDVHSCHEMHLVQLDAPNMKYPFNSKPFLPISNNNVVMVIICILKHE